MIQRLKTIAHRLHQRYLLWELRQVNAALAAIPDELQAMKYKIACRAADDDLAAEHEAARRTLEGEQRRAVIVRQIAGV